MFYYKGAFRETDNFIYFKSDVQLVENDVVIFGEKKIFYRKCRERVPSPSKGGLHRFSESMKILVVHTIRVWSPAYSITIVEVKER